MFIYRTYFKLNNFVKDIEAAQDYLSDDDMTKYLINDSSNSLKSKISSIEWILDTEISGHIDLETTEKLTTEELKNISEWVSGQNSDGIGEGFEQQNFASYWDDECASFDWRTNAYKFEEL